MRPFSNAAAGGVSRKARSRTSTPHAASSRATWARSTCKISGSTCERREPCSACGQSLYAVPLPSRPERPARWWALAWLILTVVRRVMPVRGSNRGARAIPESITTRTPSTVSELSAISVENTMRRRPGRLGASAASCSSKERAPASGKRSTAPSVTLSVAAIARRISPMPGKKTKMSPSVSRSARTTVVATLFSSRSSSRRWPLRTVGERHQCTSTGKSVPVEEITGAGSPAALPK